MAGQALLVRPPARPPACAQGRSAAELTQECERLLRDKAARARQPFYAQRLMAHALLCGNNRAAEQATKVGGLGLLQGTVPAYKVE